MDSYKRSLKNKLENETTFLNSLWMRTSLLSKSPEASEKARRNGNDLYLEKRHTAKTHREIFKHYCESVMCAPLESEPLALALGERSEFLFDIQKYVECIQDIDRAVKITVSNELKVELLCRKIECLKKLGSSEYQRVVDEIYAYFDGIKAKRQWMKELKRVKALPILKEKTSAHENEPNLPDCLSKDIDILEQIEVRHSEKYGRLIVAAKDYKPGDIIFVEDFYATTIVPSRGCISCHYCLRTAWAGIPCDECSWAIFCSEDCKQKAWKEFHDIECSVIPYMREYDSIHTENGLRLLVLGLKECGSVDKLRKELQSVDADTRAVRKGFYKDGKLSTKTIRSIYSLKVDGFSDVYVEAMLLINVVPSALVGLVKCRHFPENLNVTNVEELISNDDLLFLGALLIKFAFVSVLNSFNFEFNHNCCEVSETGSESSKECCRRALGVAPFASLINHSCFPNTDRFFTDDRKIVFYAVLPIKKNSQIFITYNASFYEVGMPERQEELQKHYAFQCDCEPCIKKWPNGRKLEESQGQSWQAFLNTSTCGNIIKRIMNPLSPVRYNKEEVEILSANISEKSKNLNQLPIYFKLTYFLDWYYARTLAFQPGSFGKCDKFSK